MTAVELAYLEGYRHAIADLRDEVHTLRKEMEQEMRRACNEVRVDIHARLLLSPPSQLRLH
jgi:hypothetical protein